jgi:hypothetical protein
MAMVTRQRQSLVTRHGSLASILLRVHVTRARACWAPDGDAKLETEGAPPLEPADPEYTRAMAVLSDATLVAAVRRMDPSATLATPLAQALLRSLAAATTQRQDDAHDHEQDAAPVNLLSIEEPAPPKPARALSVALRGETCTTCRHDHSLVATEGRAKLYEFMYRRGGVWGVASWQASASARRALARANHARRVCVCSSS